MYNYPVSTSFPGRSPVRCVTLHHSVVERLDPRPRWSPPVRLAVADYVTDQTAFSPHRGGHGGKVTQRRPHQTACLRGPRGLCQVQTFWTLVILLVTVEWRQEVFVLFCFVFLLFVLFLIINPAVLQGMKNSRKTHYIVPPHGNL